MASQFYPERAQGDWREPSLASARQIVPLVYVRASLRRVGLAPRPGDAAKGTP